VVAENGDRSLHVVKTVSEKPLLSFGILKEDNDSLLKDAISIVDKDNRTVSLELPAGSDLGTYIPAFTLPEGMTLSIGGKVVESGVTPVDFTKTQTVTVSSGDDYPRQWEVSTIVHVIRSDCEMESFMFKAELSPSVFRDVTGDIDRERRIITIPSYWADLNVPLIPTFTSSEYSTVTVDGEVQTSEVSAKIFSSPVVYTVNAEDGVNSKEWMVRIVRPTKFRIPDRSFREYLASQNGGMFDGDSLIIAQALDWTPIDDIFGAKGFNRSNVGDFTGIEFFPKIEGAMFCDATARSLDLSKNNNVRLIVWWNSQYTELNLSNSLQGSIEINQTAGDNKIRRLIFRNSRSMLNMNSPQNQLAYVDMRGSTGYIINNFSFVDNASVLIDRTLWNSWDSSHVTRRGIMAAKNMTVYLYDSDGVTILDTQYFNR
jgi:hypothetical protein